MVENKKDTDLESTDYDIAEAGELDFRLEAGRRDAIFFHVFGISCTVIATIWMFVFGSCEPSEMLYFLGMPVWISGALLIYLVMFIVSMIRLARWKEFPLTAHCEEEVFYKGGK